MHIFIGKTLIFPPADNTCLLANTSCLSTVVGQPPSMQGTLDRLWDKSCVSWWAASVVSVVVVFNAWLLGRTGRCDSRKTALDQINSRQKTGNDMDKQISWRHHSPNTRIWRKWILTCLINLCWKFKLPKMQTGNSMWNYSFLCSLVLVDTLSDGFSSTTLIIACFLSSNLY